jgi:hypothetical protein
MAPRFAPRGRSVTQIFKRFGYITLLLLGGCTELHAVSQNMPVLGERCDSFQCMYGESAGREARAQDIIRKEQLRVQALREQERVNPKPQPAPAAPPPAPKKEDSFWDFLSAGEEEKPAAPAQESVF